MTCVRTADGAIEPWPPADASSSLALNVSAQTAARRCCNLRGQNITALGYNIIAHEKMSQNRLRKYYINVCVRFLSDALS